MFGPKAVVFAADNLHGPDIDTVRLWKKQNSYVFEFHNQAQCIKVVAEIYKKLKEKENETKQIPFMLSINGLSMMPLLIVCMDTAVWKVNNTSVKITIGSR